MHYEPDSAAFPAAAYVTKWNRGIAWSVQGWETEPDEDTELSGYEKRTGNVVAVMVGDYRHFSVEPDELIPLDDLNYCHECGQIGCAHDGLAR